MADIKTQWERIERWLAAHAPEILAGLNPPATLERIREVERLLDCEFPPEVVDSFLIHNGQKWDSPGLVGGDELYDLDRILSSWMTWKELIDKGTFDDNESESGGVTSSVWYDLRWIPLTHEPGGDELCLDLNPGPAGVHGQIIQMVHDSRDRFAIAPSYGAWLTNLADQMEAELFKLDDQGYLREVYADVASNRSAVIWSVDGEDNHDAIDYLEEVTTYGSVDALEAALSIIIEQPMVTPGPISKLFGAKPRRRELVRLDAVRALVAAEIVAAAVGRASSSPPGIVSKWMTREDGDSPRRLHSMAQRSLSSLITLASSDAVWQARGSEWLAAANGLADRLKSS